MKQLFSHQDKQRIKDAVERIESKYPVEIVPVFTAESSDYAVARFRALISGVSSGLIVQNVLYLLDVFWVPFYVMSLGLVLWCLLCLVLVEFIPSLKRLLISQDRMFLVSEQKAQLEFTAQQVGSNPRRIGILIFLSLFEHKFHILTDPKGNDYFHQEMWQEVSKALMTGLKNSSVSDALVNCLHRCEELLADAHLPTDDAGESTLTNNLRTDDDQ